MARWNGCQKRTSVWFLVFLSLMASSVFAEGEMRPFKVDVVGTGQPMILIPGLGCSGDVWQETVNRYQSDFECHVFTLAGFAGQPAIQTKQYLQTMRDAVVDYIQEHELKQPTIVGHSLGGFLALWTATTAPEQVGRLVIVDALPFLPAAQNPAATVEFMRAPAEQMRTYLISQTPEQRKKTTPGMLKGMIGNAEKIEAAVAWSLASDPNTIAQAMYEMFLTDLRNDIEKIQVPVLVLSAWISGKAFGATRENTLAKYRDQYAKVENCEIWMTDVGKHFIMWDDPEGYFAAIDPFLGQVKTHVAQ